MARVVGGQMEVGNHYSPTKILVILFPLAVICCLHVSAGIADIWFYLGLGSYEAKIREQDIFCVGTRYIEMIGDAM